MQQALKPNVPTFYINFARLIDVNETQVTPKHAIQW